MTHALLAGRLPRHDEGAADIAIFNEPFAVGELKLLGKLLRTRPRAVRDRHDDVNIPEINRLFHRFGQINAEIEAGAIDADAVDEGIRTRKIDVFESAGILHRILGTLTRFNVPLEIDPKRFAGFQIAFELKAEPHHRHRFRAHHPFALAVGSNRRTEADRPNSMRITEGKEPLAGNQRHHGVRAPHALMNGRDGLEDAVSVKPPAFADAGDFIG